MSSQKTIEQQEREIAIEEDAEREILIQSLNRSYKRNFYIFLALYCWSFWPSLLLFFQGGTLQQLKHDAWGAFLFCSMVVLAVAFAWHFLANLFNGKQSSQSKPYKPQYDHTNAYYDANSQKYHG